MPNNTPPLPNTQPDNSQTVERLIYTLVTEKGVPRDQAYASLVSLGAGAVSPLINKLNDADSIARYYAAAVLGDIGDQRAVEPLIAELKDVDEEVRAEVVSALGEIGDIKAVESLLSVLQDMSEESWIRAYAAGALGQLHDKRAVASLIEALLHDGSGFVRSNAARALGALGDKRAVQPLIQALTPDLTGVQEPDELDEFKICWYSAWSLAQLADPRAVEPLIELLISSPADSLQRMLAVETLGAIGDNRALTALERVQHERPVDDTWAASTNGYIAKAIDQIKQKQP